MTNSLIMRHYWDDGELWFEATSPQPGTAADARAVRIKRFKDAGRPYSTNGGVVTYTDNYAEFRGEPAWDSRVELEWIDDDQPDLLSLEGRS